MKDTLNNKETRQLIDGISEMGKEMNKETIIKQAIEKAVEHGWLNFKGMNKSLMVETVLKQRCTNGIIFDHSFCIAFSKYLYESGTWKLLDRIKWDEDDLNEYKYLFDFIEEQFKIELVLSTDRLEYIKRFMGG